MRRLAGLRPAGHASESEKALGSGEETVAEGCSAPRRRERAGLGVKSAGPVDKAAPAHRPR